MEMWDAYFSDGSLANTDLVRGEAVPEGMYHLVSEILVKHIDGDYLLMQRDFVKPNFGGYFDVGAGGSALKGEDEVMCAKRELLEETGISADVLEKIGRYVSRNTIYYEFLCVTDCDKSSILLQKGETISYKWMNENDFIEFINSDAMIPPKRARYYEYFKKMGYIKEYKEGD